MMVIGLALGLESVTVRPRDGGTAGSHSWAIPALRDDPEVWTEVSRVFDLIRGAIGPSVPRSPGLAVHLAILPPLVQVRRIMLPRLRDHELRRVLSRDVGRYLFGVTSPQVIGIQRVGNGRRSPEPVLLAATPQWVVDGLERAVRSVGWEIAAIGPAHAAWTAASASDGPVTIIGETFAEVLQVEAGRLLDVRRKPLGSSLPESTPLSSPEVTAAGHAQAVAAFELLPKGVAKARAAWSRRLTGRLWLGAAALVLLSLGLSRWDLARELAAVRTERAMLRAQVTSAMTFREQLEAGRATLVTLAEAEANAARWTTVLGLLAEQLPVDAYVTGFRGQGDSLALEGTAEEAGGVFGALQQADGIAGVQATAPIRQVAGEDDVTVERFALTVRLRQTDAEVREKHSEAP